MPGAHFGPVCAVGADEIQLGPVLDNACFLVQLQQAPRASSQAPVLVITVEVTSVLADAGPNRSVLACAASMWRRTCRYTITATPTTATVHSTRMTYKINTAIRIPHLTGWRQQ